MIQSLAAAEAMQDAGLADEVLQASPACPLRLGCLSGHDPRRESPFPVGESKAA